MAHRHEAGNGEPRPARDDARAGADERHSLENPDDGDEGDAGDPFPGSAGKTQVGDQGDTSTSFPNVRSGITLQNIPIDDASGGVKLDVMVS